ncbi:hypothetical protein E4U30_006831 [Claviceps sp. LM220 group G6]|nr:hypothetical protein E4U15_001606 [Claviceps sp. LM218 group G6]KAG6091503.1 hypothetical protein E4U30_006831 [Claviceps sp. LM220 group G6]KAG6103192.1 hypothetical protein E4U31_003024 [Claviceps sp. LM219 group G6]KAG6116018.1 hypothetical protein E4U14_000562 [Claviceps sp. LM454 group G7]
MAKPRLIIVIRHAQSEGNKNRKIHQSVPDHRVKLTTEGWAQAHEAGRRLRNLLRADDTLQIFTSPYRRTRETTEGILATLTSNEPTPSPFRRDKIKVYEEPRLREQDFGNFQPCSAAMERMWQERADYGHFFYRIANGESAADAYDRVSGFNESLWRQFGDEDFPSVCVLVTHGLMSRVFLMKWYHFDFEYFEDLRNVDHCEFLLMRKQSNGKYLLESKLRTWSELRQERALRESSDSKDSTSTTGGEGQASDDKVETGRQWGGCPDGCNHSNPYQTCHVLDALRQEDNERLGYDAHNLNTDSTHGTTSTVALRKQLHKPTSIVAGGDGDGSSPQDQAHIASSHPPSSSASPRVTARLPENSTSQKQRLPNSQVVSSSCSSASASSSFPDGTPALPARDEHRRKSSYRALHIGRDFGGTYSGHTSTAGSDDDTASCDERATLQRESGSGSGSGSGSRTGKRKAGDMRGADLTDEESRRAGRYANRLGDASPQPEACSELEDLDEAERKDRSLRGSVY